MSSNFKSFRLVAAATLLCIGAGTADGQTTLGTFTFNNGLFGNSLVQGDGGAWANNNYLSVAPGNPGSPGYLTGVGFNTGIGNINNIAYTIGYDTPIFNNGGNDVGVVMARFSANPFSIAFSADGVSFGAAQTFGTTTAVNSGESRTYRYAGWGSFTANLFVQSIDLSAFGIGAGESVRAVRIIGQQEFDLVRVAGFNSAVEEIVDLGDGGGFRQALIGGQTTVTPEPSTYVLMAAGLAGLAAVTRRRNRATAV